MIELRVSEPDPIVLEAEEQDQASLAVIEAFVSGGDIPAYTGSYNVTPTQSQQTLETNGKKMTRDVKVAAIPSQYIIPSGTKEITENGQQSVREYENVNVDVPAPTGEKTINVTQNGTTTEDVTNYATAKVVTNVPASAVDSGTKNINSNGTHNVVGYASAAVNVPNSYSASDEGKVVQSGALVSQSSQTIDTNGTYDTTTKNEVVVDVQGGGGRVLLASLTALQNEPTMSINYDAQTMGAYKIFEMEVTGTSVGNLYICPQLNGTSSRGYFGNHNNSAFYRRYMVSPTYERNGLTIAGYNVDYGNGYGSSFWLASDTITSFDLRSYYDTSAYFGAGTVFNLYGIPNN